MPTGAILCTAAVALPLLGALAAALAHRRASPRSLTAVALASALASAALIGRLWRPDAAGSWRVPWVEAMGLGLGWHPDRLALLLALMVAVAAVLTVAYSHPYWRRVAAPAGLGDRLGTYYAAMLVFTASMLGLALSEDLFQLYVFWELADVASFVLIALDRREPRAWSAAVRALLFTALGGLALLVALVLLVGLTGTSSIPAIVSAGPLDADPAVVGAIVVLVAIAAATKSAQFPFHVWLPPAMIALTPINAFLDSAALVAAGVFLLARLQPVLGEAMLWPWVLGAIGLASMVAGGIAAMRQTDPKWLLAYSTISQFGFMFVLLALGAGGLAAALWFLMQHAIVKAALFFAFGITERGQAPRLTPAAGYALAAAAALPALSLAGVPPLAGFWMKELYLKRALEAPAGALLAGVGVVAAALTLAYTLRYLTLVLGDRSRPSGTPSRPMLAVVAILALLTVAFGLFPEPVARHLIEPAAAAAGASSGLSFEYELGPALLLSGVALATGAALYAVLRRRPHLLESDITGQWPLAGPYARLVAAVMGLGRALLSVQNGALPRYIHGVLLGLASIVTFAVLAAAGGDWAIAADPVLDELPAVRGAQALLLGLVAVGTVVVLAARAHLRAILALGAVGYALGALFALIAAPDLALVQVHVETLVTVLFALALVRVPRQVRRRFAGSPPRRWRAPRLAVAALAGLLAAALSWVAIEHTPAQPVAVWYNENAEALVEAPDVVAAILVHFRAMDTVGEVAVFAIALLGVAVLVRLAREQKEQGA